MIVRRAATATRSNTNNPVTLKHVRPLSKTAFYMKKTDRYHKNPKFPIFFGDLRKAECWEKHLYK